MKKLSKKNLRNIKHIFQEETGASIQFKNNTAMPVVIVSIIIVVVVVGGLNLVWKFPTTKTKDTEVELINYNSAHKGEEGFEVIVEQGTEAAVKLRFEDWVWPTESDRISSYFGKRENGLETDHINIPGEVGDPIYAVYDGTVLEADYEFEYGNYIVIQVDDKTTVKYGHLNNIYVAAGTKVSKGEQIGELGNTGCSTGPNLSFGVYMEDEGVNPITK